MSSSPSSVSAQFSDMPVDGEREGERVEGAASESGYPMPRVTDALALEHRSSSMLNESEFDELIRLRSEVATLNNNYDLLIQTLHTLTGDYLKRRHAASPSEDASSISSALLPLKRTKHNVSIPSSSASLTNDSPFNNLCNSLPSLDKPSGLSPLPAEVLLHIFRFCQREDLDRCQLVCRQWRSIITTHQTQLSRRNVRLVNVVENNGSVTIAVSSGSRKIKFNYLLHNEQNASEELNKAIVRTLQYSTVRRLLMCGFELNEVIAHDIASIMRRADVTLTRVELIGMSIGKISASSFHRFLGDHLFAKEYFIDGVKDADIDHFNSAFFEKPGIAQSLDLFIFDAATISDEDLNLEVGDDVLLDNFFGKHVGTDQRNSLYLDSPSISSSFVYSALLRFANEDDLSCCLPHAEYAHVRDQTVHPSRCIQIEYITDIQCEFSAKNVKNNRILEAKIYSLSDDHGFVHITFRVL